MPRLSPRAAAAQLAASFLLVLAALVPGTAGATAGAAASAAAADPFYTYDGAQPLSSYEPGEVLKTRTLSYHVVGIPTPVQAVQILYRSTDAQGKPAANVTSVLKPPGKVNGNAVSYQSFYDSMNPEDGPSRAIAGDVSLGGLIANVESIFIAPLLAQGYTVLVPDTEGQDANFAAGPEYGYNTLDGIRAASAAEATGLTSATRVGMLGYSGGAIATSWAGTLAPEYAPDVNRRLVGFTEGGLLVAPAHNLKYVSGSLVWSGIAPMAIAGVARSYDIDFDKYLNDKGKQVIAKMQQASIINVLGQYPGLTWKQLVKPEYANPNSVPEYVDTVNKLNLGSAPTPTVPMFVAQGGGGYFEGTSGTKPGIGAGDGVMVAGDVRTLMRQYCATGAPAVKYQQYSLLSHVGATVPWAPLALLWLNDRFAGKAAPSDCGRIAAGNPLTPEAHE
ncbi:lipase family protein [Nocardioides speluncae]|uniref:lipase family protein n=1 Tax=Nocardioides speluncae TaxID=2670337 RepID=UPI000D68EBCF|nr:lipase family protein [Nocardioides speluncae]